MNEAQQTLLAQVPDTGTVAYDNVRRLLLGQGRGDAVAEFHALRRSKQLHAWTDDKGILLISKQPRPTR